MENNQDKIKQLLHKLDLLHHKQQSFSAEISALRKEISKLQETSTEQTTEETKVTSIVSEKPIIEQKAALSPPPSVENQEKARFPKQKSDLEKFIGENLINKIGIAITVIGVAIGAKYAIDNEMVSPLTRIILGYLVGLGLLGFALKLKKKYENFSAVLLSGAMAIIYFLTYAAHAFYGLIPQAAAFALMVVFTCFTVFAAIKYNNQVIAHVGLVGAYAVPFLLSDGSGRVEILFSYMAIINIGILVIAFKKYWKSLYYASFIISWLIFSSWFFSSYEQAADFYLALTFASVFFTIFYVTFLSYKLIRKEKFELDDILLVLVNSFVFYGLGYAILSGHDNVSQYLGFFTLANAFVHFGVSMLIRNKNLGDKNIFYLIMGLVLVFLTIAIPVQMDGNWVTLLWAGEAALLFWIARTREEHIYEQLSYPLMILAFASLIHDWLFEIPGYSFAGENYRFTPLLNIHFLSSVLFIAAFGFINYVNQKWKNLSAAVPKWINYAIPAIFLFSLYYSFRLEISHYWDQRFAESAIHTTGDRVNYYNNYALNHFQSIWIIIYSMGFLAALSFLNLKKLRNSVLAKVNLYLNILTILVFLTQGLYELSELREIYLNQTLTEYYNRDFFHIGIRYISFIFIASLLFASYKYVQDKLIAERFKVPMDLIIHGSIIWILSSELINWMEIQGFEQSYKLGLSILWGIYCLFLIILGIWKNKKHLRIGAISLFAVTLIKLFFYDISHLDTISKTIVFVSLGVLLLIISFLYNKYKNIISNEAEVNS